MARKKLPATRKGKTYTMKLGNVVAEFTVNKDEDGWPREVICKCNEGYQGHIDGMCIVSSLAMQENREIVKLIIKHLRYRNFPPFGNAGQPKSLSDALAIVLEKCIPEEK